MYKAVLDDIIVNQVITYNLTDELRRENSRNFIG